MINRRIVAMATAVLAAVLTVLTCLPGGGGQALGRDAGGGGGGGSARSAAVAVTKSTSGPGNMRRRRMRNAEYRPRIFEQDRFTEANVKEVLAFAKKHFPEEYERIETLRKESPRQAKRVLRRLWWLYQRVRHLPPEIQAAAVAKTRLNVAIFRTRRALLEAEDAAKKTELTKKLRSLLGEQFDNDQIVKEYRVKRLAQQLAELKAEIEQRKNDRQKIIADRLKRLTSSKPAAMMQPYNSPGRPGRPGRPAPPPMRR